MNQERRGREEAALRDVRAIGFRAGDSDLAPSTAYRVTPPGGRSHGETRFQRPISQPFVRENVAQIRFPARVPTMRALCGPP